MKAGKIASTCLLLIFTAAVVAVTAGTPRSPTLAALDEPTRLLVIGCGAAVALGLIVLPLGFLFDRAVHRLRDHIEAASDDTAAEAADRPSRAHFIAQLGAAVDDLLDRERSLRSQVRDIEIRRQVSEAERRQVEAVLHALRHPVIVTDAFNEIVIANEAAARILEFDAAEAIHRAVHDVIRDERLCQLISDARGGAFADCRHVEHELARPDGEESPARTYDVALACVPNHKQEVGGVVTILHDLTRERELSEMKTDFVSKASHELRTPLSSIRAYVEMLVDGEAGDEAARIEFYRIIQGETERLSRLIDNMLNISRIEAGIVQIDRETVDVTSLIERAVGSLEPQARDRGIAMHVRLAAVSLCVEGDPDMLYQVVLNLLSNGVKYTPEGGRVTIAADSDNLTRSVVVTVSDTGLGIPPDALPRLFDKFYRVENYKRVAKGTGLGLSLCKHIVETVHHGQIGVDSKLGMGSRFWFSVPMRYEGSQAAA